MVKVNLLWKRSIIFCLNVKNMKGCPRFVRCKYITNRNMHSFNKIMSSNGDIVINRVAKLINKALKSAVNKENVRCIIINHT